ncbi:MAG: class I SAM-dependent RNA methyltransferase [Dermabacter sp.]|nr:class I SAM-dependent RNA methyltransferase [Dermabacter sp.]
MEQSTHPRRSTLPSATAPTAGAGHAQPVDDPAALITVTIDKPAHGGVFVARHAGRVVFVRGATPGETVVARLLPESDASARFWRAEAIEVIEPGPDRVPSVWPESGAGGVGGADFAHVQLEAQRRIKTEVVQELLARAGVSTFPIEDVQVEPAADDHTGLGWRTRVRFAASGGTVGMRGWRSHEIHPVGDNPLAHETIRALGLESWSAPAAVSAIDAVAPSVGEAALIVRASEELTLEQLELPAAADEASVLVVTERSVSVLRGSPTVTEVVGDEVFEVSAGGFWQVHTEAPRLLSEAVMSAARPQPGEVAWDLYGGAGLFSRPLAIAVGPTGRLVSVEGSASASTDAAANLAALPQATAVRSDVADFVARPESVLRGVGSPACVVMDPPRAGVGEQTMARLCRAVSRVMVYVSCEPSTLARDLVVAEKNGWRVADLRAFDLFPHTHHVECVVRLEPGDAPRV